MVDKTRVGVRDDEARMSYDDVRYEVARILEIRNGDPVREPRCDAGRVSMDDVHVSVVGGPSFRMVRRWSSQPAPNGGYRELMPCLIPGY